MAGGGGGGGFGGNMPGRDSGGNFNQNPYAPPTQGQRGFDLQKSYSGQQASNMGLGGGANQQSNQPVQFGSDPYSQMLQQQYKNNPQNFTANLGGANGANTSPVAQNNAATGGASSGDYTDMINSAYGNIGRAGIGNNANQIDQAGYNYWNNQLQSGAVSPRDFNKSFQTAAQTVNPALADQFQNQALSQISGARPAAGSSQFYQPVYQGQYNNYATTNPLGVSQYGTQMTPQSMVDSAYAGIGRYGAGSGVNQVDPAGRQYWNNQLSSGAVAPQDFNKSFNSAVQQYQQQNPYSALTQYTQNQPGYSGGYGGYGAPQQSFQMNNPFNPYTGGSQSSYGYGGGMGGGMGGYGGQQQYQPQPQYQQQYQPQQSYEQGFVAPQQQPIYSRSSQVSRPTRYMSYATGGITKLLKK